MKEAAFWTPEKGRVRCGLCPHACLIADGASGRCRVRAARMGRLYAEGYGRVSSAHMDPVEKKPLYHFFPGSVIFSVGGWGCNFSCSFCQNWSISQKPVADTDFMTPADVVAAASGGGSIGIAYTYNEPLVGYEFVLDCAAIARARGLKNVLVTNGFVNRGPAEGILDLIDALNIDIKSVRDEFYVEYCGGRLGPVLDFAEQAKRAGCHVEITNLLIPGLNDTEDEGVRLSSWIAEHLGPSTPLHLSAYFPQYRMELPPTPAGTLAAVRKRCLDRLDHVYMGNVRSDDGQDTRCRSCGAVLVRRRGYAVAIRKLDGSRCGECGEDAGFVNG